MRRFSEMKFALVLLVCLISIFSSSHAAIQIRTNRYFSIYLDDDTGLFTVSGFNDNGVELPILFGADVNAPTPLSSFITIHSSSSNTLYITGKYNSDPSQNSIDPTITAFYMGTPSITQTTDQFKLHYAPSTAEFTADVTISLILPSGASTMTALVDQIQPSVLIQTEITNLLSAETTFTVNYVLDYSVDLDDGPTFRSISEASSRQHYARVITDPKFDYYILEANYPVEYKYTVVGSVNVPARYLEEIAQNDFTQSQVETSSTIHDVYGYLYTVAPKLLTYTAMSNVFYLAWAITKVQDQWGNDHDFTSSVAQGLEFTHRGFYDPTALQDDSAVVHTWELKLKPGNSDVTQASFFINTATDNYVGEQDTRSCSDSFACTWDYFADVDCYDSECINLPVHQYCNDDNLCTIDLCDQTSATPHDQDGCVHIPKNCDDEIPCTRDYCDPFTGACVHDKTPSGFAISCDDQNPCTKDYCEESNLGKCINEPNDDICNTTIDKCNTHYCDGRPYVGGCNTRPVNCDDDIKCTDDSCSPTSGCSNTPNNLKCDDNIDCTQDVCDVSLGKCMNYPTNTLCDDNDLCTTDYCDIHRGCVHVSMECHKTEISCTLDYCVGGYCIHVADDAQCNDNVSCTVDHCNLHLSECTIKTDDSRCDDGKFCTDDYCDMASGCRYLPHICDDHVPCSSDRCDTVLDRCVSDTSNQAVVCDDGVDCTADICDMALGTCVHLPNDNICDDNDACTTDYCDVHRGCIHVRKYCNDQNACTNDECINGTCVYTSNAASTAFCDDNVQCTEDRCDLKVGCLHVPLDFRCNDNIACTDDKCTGAGCTHTANDFNCDDNIACTIDSCNPYYGCTHTPVDLICNDNLNSTIDSCDPFIGCIFQLDSSACISGSCSVSLPTYKGCAITFYDSLCNDNIDCTNDYCGTDGECVNEPRHSQCSDNVGCTDDVCSTNATVGLGCVHIANADHCSDGRSCTKETCDEQYGCIIEYTALCPKDTGDEHCMNCASPRSRIGLTDYDDGTADFRIQTRLEPVIPFSTVSPHEGLTENMLIKSWGSIVFGQEEYLDHSPAVVIGANSGLRLVPTTDSLPRCNEISRGMMIVRESMDSTGSITDAMFVCLHEDQSYSWERLV